MIVRIIEGEIVTLGSVSGTDVDTTAIGINADANRAQRIFIENPIALLQTATGIANIIGVGEVGVTQIDNVLTISGTPHSPQSLQSAYDNGTGVIQTTANKSVVISGTTGEDALRVVGSGTFTEALTVGEGSTYLNPISVTTASGVFTSSLTISGIPVPLQGGGVNDHGNLTGLSDDDHIQYPLVDGTRAFTGAVGGITPAVDTDLTTRLFVTSISGNLSTEIDSDISIHAGDSSAHHSRYIDTEAITATESSRFVMSGTLSTEIDSDINIHTTISNAHHIKYTDGEAISALEPTTSALSASGVATDSNVVSVSGHLQTRIDAVEASDVDSINVQTGLITITGSMGNGVNTSTVGGIITLTAVEAEIDHDILLNFASNEHFTEASIDHGSILGLGNDTHPQYSLVDGVRAFTGTIGGITPAADADLTTRLFVTSISGHLSTEIDTDIVTHTAISNVHHAKYTNAEAIVALEPTTSKLAASGVATDANIVSVSGHLSTEIDTDISTHAADISAHHIRYADSEAISATESARFTMSGTLSTEIDNDIITHVAISNAHHTKYTDTEAILALESTTSQLSASGVATDTNLVAVSGHLQNEIDLIDASVTLQDAYNNGTGIITASVLKPFQVTGSGIITGDLTVDTNTLFVDSIINKVGIGTVNPSSTGLLTIKPTTGLAQLLFENPTAVDKAFIGTESIFGDPAVIADDLRIRSDSSNIWFGFSGAVTSVMTNTGRVGIGTVSPTEELHVIGNEKVEGSLTVTQPSNTVATLDVISGDAASSIRIKSGSTVGENSDLDFFDRGIAEWILRKDAGNSFRIISQQPTVTTPVIIRSGTPDNQLFLNSDGNTGLGTTNPVESLHVVGSGIITGDLTVGDNTVDLGIIRLKGALQECLVFNRAGTDRWRIDDISNNIRIVDLTNNTAPFTVQVGASTSSLTINSDGNVGLGTGSATEKLHVVGSGIVEGNLTITEPNDAGAILDLISGDNESSIRIKSGTTLGQNSDLEFHDRGIPQWILRKAINNNISFLSVSPTITTPFKIEIASPDNQLYLKSDGNIGMGISNPSEKLHVVGSGIFTGDLNVTGSGIITNNFHVGTNLLNVREDLIKIGIGVSKPITKLHLKDGEFRIDSSVPTFSFDGAASAGRIEFKRSANTKMVINLDGSDNFFIQNDLNQNVLTFIQGTDQTNSIYLDSNSLLGIGTNSPTEKLHVVGSGIFTGDLDVDGDYIGLPKFITIEHPTGTDNISFFFSPKAETVSEIIPTISGTEGGSGIEWSLRFGPDRSNHSGASELIIGGSETALLLGNSGNILTSFDNPNIPANNFIWVETTAISGTVAELSLNISL